MMTERCFDCRFWHKRGDWTTENCREACRRHAPMLTHISTVQQYQPEGQYPHTVGLHWCGDFEARPTGTEPAS